MSNVAGRGGAGTLVDVVDPYGLDGCVSGGEEREGEGAE